MRNLIDQAVSWDKLGGNKTEYHYELGKATLCGDTGMLRLPVTLNFIIPFMDYEKIRALTINKIAVVKDVEMEFQYQNVVMDTDQIIRLFTPHMVHILQRFFRIHYQGDR